MPGELPDDMLGDLLGGRYRIVERLGAGGMCVVWRGHDEVLGRQVAIKLPAGPSSTDPEFRRRLRIEAQAAARLTHPHITQVYDYGEGGEVDDPVPYVVMELVEGRSLAERLRGGQALPWRQAATVCTQVAAALAAAHGRGLVHRDVTPGNVMLTSSGAKVLDFGISALVGEPDTGPDGALLGTPAYLAPERIDGGPVTPAADIYALGVLLYRTLAGRLPWDASTATELVRAHRSATPQPLPDIPDLPPDVAGLCARCLAKDPADRPTSVEVARELGAALGAAPELDEPDLRPAGPVLPDRTRLLSLPTGARPCAVRGRRRARVAVSAGGLLLAAGMAWAGTSWWPGGQEPPGPAAAGTGGPRPTGCGVEYRVTSDTGRAFTAHLTVENIGTEALRGWRLTFDLPGDQRLAGGTAATWRQDGRTVTADGGGALRPGESLPLTLTAGYRTGNPLPTSFELDGDECRAVLVGAPSAATLAGGRAGTGAGSAQTDEATPGAAATDKSGKGKGSGNSGSANKGSGNKGKGKK